jgi:hypothetical protein
LSGLATLQEIDADWSLADLVQANMALDLKDHAERLANKPTET